MHDDSTCGDDGGACSDDQVFDSITCEATGNAGAGHCSAHTLLDEYTTDLLKTNTVAALPSYSGTYLEYSEASVELDGYESSYSISRQKGRLRHFPTGTCYLKVWLRTRFHPDTGSDILTDLAPYEWIGGGNPCLADPSKSYTDLANLIEHDLGELTEADCPANGTVTWEIVKWSCVSGYVPPDDGSANGFPVS